MPFEGELGSVDGHREAFGRQSCRTLRRPTGKTPVCALQRCKRRLFRGASLSTSLFDPVATPFSMCSTSVRPPTKLLHRTAVEWHAHPCVEHQRSGERIHSCNLGNCEHTEQLLSVKRRLQIPTVKNFILKYGSIRGFFDSQEADIICLQACLPSPKLQGANCSRAKLKFSKSLNCAGNKAD